MKPLSGDDALTYERIQEAIIGAIKIGIDPADVVISVLLKATLVFTMRSYGYEQGMILLSTAINDLVIDMKREELI